ncbi:MAG: ABC-type branched-chain amino acid transport systems, periplasmic component [uncultured Thiotrichaceae bacterium]|uniref:ABC-type branched-chain amino acid transport systems, periplasmic component n=1 Tax=uncultured Thiotrichaceae bacterium TaxID=298394 RepID=A0A6S6S683_9GAMM|nr:MAG: ABC-type branched-chain amino acid transport systems, periplasmic component [uncultured Thiotrichaceae bacterium]
MNNKKRHILTIGKLSLLILAQALPSIASSEDGVNKSEITIGGVMDLEGRSSRLGLGMKAGIEAAIKDQTVAGKKINFVTLNDSYNPTKTKESTNKLVQEKVFLFAGNVGTPTAKVALPILEDNKIPAIGFFTGAGLLRNGSDNIINYRASYVQETKAVIDAALKQGVRPEGICAYVQNDAYGMAGIKGIRKALDNASNSGNSIKALDKILKMEGNRPKRNGMGPVGVYARNTFTARAGYDSLKLWERKQGASCRLVVTVGAYDSVSRFIAYAKSKNEPWVYSAVSFTGAETLASTLKKFGVSDKVIMTQVVPLGDSNLPIVKEARNALGKEYGHVSQEGYIVGKLLLHGLRQINSPQGTSDASSDTKKNNADKPITRENLIAAFKGNKFDLGGLEMDFSDDNQGSDLVVLTKLLKNKWVPLKDSNWNALLNMQVAQSN